MRAVPQDDALWFHVAGQTSSVRPVTLCVLQPSHTPIWRMLHDTHLRGMLQVQVSDFQNRY
jgi:hypothetical protein